MKRGASGGRKMWHKQGLIYVPNGKFWWAQSYALLPTAEVIDDEIIRVYYASLDENRHGRIGYIDLEADNPGRIIYENPEPVLDIGETGAFDDSGVNPSCVINLEGKKYLYYIGWQRCERVPYALYIGLAVSSDGTSFRRVSRAPVLDRTNREPYLRSAITIYKDVDRLVGWYVSGIGWTHINNKPYPTYIIRRTDSQDGVSWSSYKDVCINFENPGEFGFGRPWVIKAGQIYRMWYSIRSKISPYRIGTAESKDGIKWNRKDNEVGIARSTEGWDSKMICYPCVIEAKGKRYMFYNGNQHGQTGFGFAVSDNE